MGDVKHEPLDVQSPVVVKSIVAVGAVDTVGVAVGGPGHTTLEQSVVVVHVAGVVTWSVSVHSHVPLNESSNAAP